MGAKTIIVCEAQVPFVRGGAEYLVRDLVGQLREHGHAVELVSLPFKWYPKQELLAHAAAWRLVDLSESNGRTIDLAIATKFPTYFVRHPRKVAWIMHQYRAAYELCGTEYSDFTHTEGDVGLRQRILDLDGQMLGECQRLFTIARNISARLAKFNGLAAEPLYHPPRLATRLRPGPLGDYVLSVGRLETVKRVDLAVRAMTRVDTPLQLLVAGDGTQQRQLESLAHACGVADRVRFLGAVEDEALVELYAGALAVVYPPFEEDLGYVTLEAFLARKPVITARDSGGPLEFVEDGVNGYCVEPEPEALAAAINRLGAHRATAASFGDAGFARASTITWDGVVEKLVGEA